MFNGEDGYDYRLEYITDPFQQVWINANILLHSTGGRHDGAGPRRVDPEQNLSGRGGMNHEKSGFPVLHFYFEP